MGKRALLFYFLTMWGMVSAAWTGGQKAIQPLCFYLASYAPGYAWQDGITEAVTHGLAGVCRLQVHYMDSKKVTDPAQLEALGEKARQAIMRAKPAILLASDDNAMKYVVQPYFRNVPLPVVFCGLNDTGQPYGLPYKNTTGMVEKMPFKKMMQALHLYQRVSHKPALKVALFVSHSTTSEKNIHTFTRLLGKQKIPLTVIKVQNFTQWKQQFAALNQQAVPDVLLLGNTAPIPDWQTEEAEVWVKQHTRKFTLAYLPNMRPYALINIEKSPQEQGAWMAASARAILLKGYQPDEMNIVPNRQFPVMVNQVLLARLPALKWEVEQISAYLLGAH